VGQDEVDVVRVADVVMVVLVPGMGDDIQTIKAGIMEIPDIFVLNKADRDGIDRLHADVQTMLSLAETSPHRARPAIVRTVATSGTGLPELRAAIEGSLSSGDGEALAGRRRERSRERLMGLLHERVLERAREPGRRASVDLLVAQMTDRTLDPHAAADALVRELFANEGG
jgi:LAO/AO transport system kinase